MSSCGRLAFLVTRRILARPHKALGKGETRDFTVTVRSASYGAFAMDSWHFAAMYGSQGRLNATGEGVVAAGDNQAPEFCEEHTLRVRVPTDRLFLSVRSIDPHLRVRDDWPGRLHRAPERAARSSIDTRADPPGRLGRHEPRIRQCPSRRRACQRQRDLARGRPRELVLERGCRGPVGPAHDLSSECRRDT